jgi:hypothetical protein
MKVTFDICKSRLEKLQLFFAKQHSTALNRRVNETLSCVRILRRINQPPAGRMTLSCSSGSKASNETSTPSTLACRGEREAHIIKVTPCTCKSRPGKSSLDILLRFVRRHLAETTDDARILKEINRPPARRRTRSDSCESDARLHERGKRHPDQGAVREVQSRMQRRER